MELDAEGQLNRLGLQIEEFDLGRADEPDIVGYAVLEWLDLDHTAYQARLLVPLGATSEIRARFASWCLGVIPRWVEHGPEMDGWQRRESDAGWQLWCRQVYLPSVD